MVKEYYAGRSSGSKKYSTRSVDVGSRRGKVMHVTRNGRTLQKVKVRLHGGANEYVCFNQEFMVNPGDRVAYTKKKDGRCTRGARAVNVKFL